MMDALACGVHPAVKPGFLPIDVVCILGKTRGNSGSNRKSQDYKGYLRLKGGSKGN